MKWKVKIKDSWHEKCYVGCSGYVYLDKIQLHNPIPYVTVYLDDKSQKKILQFNKEYKKMYTITPTITFNCIKFSSKKLMDTE